MPIPMHGHWRLTVSTSVHTLPNRFQVIGAATGNGIYPPTVGSTIEVDGLPAWQLRAEFEDPDQPGIWKASDMTIVDRVQNGAELQYLIGAEDPLPRRDFKDIQWEAKHLGPMIRIPYRPYAVRMSDLYQMPDGIFETALGMYYMAVRVTNTWGEPLTESDVLDISPGGRANLAARGILVLDAWSDQELQSLGQVQRGTGIVIGPLDPGDSRTVYFKLNVAAAQPRKHFVDFVCLNLSQTPDPHSAKRRVRKAIFVSRSFVDQATGELVSTFQEGTARMRLFEVALDQRGAKRHRRRNPPATPPADSPSIQELRNLLEALVAGRPVDPCVVQRVLACCGACRDKGSGNGCGPPLTDGRFTYDPFYMIPTKFAYSITPRSPFEGQYGPIPFDDPWWKIALLIAAVVLLIAGALSEATDLAYHDEDLIIGSLDRSQQDDIDAALAILNGSRTVPLPIMTVLDAQTGELNIVPAVILDSTLGLNGPPLTAAEVNDILLLPLDDPQRQVFKSGARTGLTHGMIVDLTPFTDPRVGDGAVFNLPQLVVNVDPLFNQDVGDNGDSGSIWVQTSSMRPVALNHSGTEDNNTAVGSLLVDVAAAFNLTFE